MAGAKAKRKKKPRAAVAAAAHAASEPTVAEKELALQPAAKPDPLQEDDARSPGGSKRREAKGGKEKKQANVPPAGASAEAVDNRGVIHLATIPMCMTADKVRHLMEEFGEIGRVFLQAEDKTTHNRRKKTGGNRKTRFVEGWVEFADKRVAKRVALALNGHQIGGRKRFFRDDMWNMKYLSKFKWYQLKEGAIYNHQVRKARLEQKVSQARRENDFFLEKLHQAKTNKKIEEKRASKADRGDGAKSGIKRGIGGDERFPAAKRRAGGAGAERIGMAPKIADISDKVLGSLL